MSSKESQTTLLSINNLQISKSQVVIVYTEWNESVINELRKGVQDILSQYPEIETKEIAVPGAIEIPFAIQQIYKKDRPDAFIALGCVIKGDTPHFDYVCQSITQGITILNTNIESPIVFGILTVNNYQQAMDRVGGKDGHKGQEAAITALKMINFKQNFN